MQFKGVLQFRNPISLLATHGWNFFRLGCLLANRMGE